MDNIVVFEADATDAYSAINLCGNKMIEFGFISYDFIEECIKREEEFPTGIIGDIPFAIPHAKSSNINKDCLCLLRLLNPVEFKRMDDFDQTVPTRLVFNFAIKNSDNHIIFLQKFISLVQKKEFLESCSQLPIHEVCELVNKKLNGF